MALPLGINKGYTVEEFEQMPEFDERYELLDGKLVERKMPTYQHGFLIERIRDAIKTYYVDKRFDKHLTGGIIRLA